jgi:hypothetical protein
LCRHTRCQDWRVAVAAWGSDIQWSKAKVLESKPAAEEVGQRESGRLVISCPGHHLEDSVAELFLRWSHGEIPNRMINTVRSFVSILPSVGRPCNTTIPMPMSLSCPGHPVCPPKGICTSSHVSGCLHTERSDCLSPWYSLLCPSASLQTTSRLAEVKR